MYAEARNNSGLLDEGGEFDSQFGKPEPRFPLTPFHRRPILFFEKLFFEN
jgi:hypothetical protein